MLGFGSTELIILLLLALIFFGAGKLSSIGSVLGRCVASFRQGRQDAEAIDITPDKEP